MGTAPAGVVAEDDGIQLRATSFYIEPNANCQLRCSGCCGTMHKLDRIGQQLSLDAIAGIAESKYFDTLKFFNQGEPLLYKNLDKALQILREQHFKIVISTNGQNLLDCAEILVKNQVDHLLLAIDGTSQEIYEKYRVGGSLQKILDGLKVLQHLKESSGSPFPRVALQFILFEHNQCQLDAIHPFAERYGFDEWMLKTTLLSHGGLAHLSREKIGRSFFKIHHLTPIYKQKRRNAQNIFAFHNINPINTLDFSKSIQCFEPVVLCSGDVALCCWDGMGKRTIGSIYKQTLDEILESEIYKDFLQSMTMTPHGWMECQKISCSALPRHSRL